MTAVLKLPRIKVRTVPLVVHGTAPLIIHDWHDRLAIAKDDGPEQMYDHARLIDERGDDGIYAAYFKLAAVRAAEHFDKIPKTMLRGALFIEPTRTRQGHTEPKLLPLSYDRRELRRDVIQLRDRERIYGRPEYHNWRVKLPLTLNMNVLSPEDVVELFEVAGRVVGVGRRRPEEQGQNGTFSVFAEG